MGLFDKLQSKIELFKLEQRYTRRKRRTTFISDAHYVDGEYIYNYQQPASPNKSSFRASDGLSSRRSNQS